MAMIEFKLVGLGCSRSWRMEDKLIRLSRELGIPIQIFKVMELENILAMELKNIPALLAEDGVWSYDEIMQDGAMRKILVKLDQQSTQYDQAGM